MKRTFTLFQLALLSAVCLSANLYGQTPTPQDTTRPTVPLYNAGFDVIIKKNGDIVYGLVLEVGLQLIKYQRTDIPNGPVYTMPRYEVYAISYRNQVKEILDDEAVVVPPPGYGRYYDRPYDLRRPAFLKEGAVRLGLGFIRTYTRVSNAGDYSSSPTFPVVSIAYDANYRNQFRPGVQIAFGSRKFSGQEYSTYDSTQSVIDIKENIFTLHLYARYHFSKGTSAFQPYVLGGLGITTSNIHTDYNISFINNPGKVVQVKSGSRAVGLGVLARIGTDYYFNSRLAAFGDIGLGPSLLNFGVSAHID
jgi:hypothetical protein